MGGGLAWKGLGTANKGTDSSFVTAASGIMLSVKEILGCHLLFRRKITITTTTWASCIDQNAAMFIGITFLPEGYNSCQHSTDSKEKLLLVPETVYNINSYRRFVEKGPEELSAYTEREVKPESCSQPAAVFDSASPNLLKSILPNPPHRNCVAHCLK